MSRLKKRLFISAAFALLILLCLVLFFYRPTRLALERAESFKFRRMLVTRLGEKETYRFFYVTNRELEKAEAPAEERFGTQRKEGLTYGSFDTGIEPTLGLGMLINPTDWFQNEEIQLRQVKQLESDDFVGQLRRQVRASPFQSVLINVNGFRERFPSALRKTAFLSHVLDIDSPVVAFDWPGNQGTTPRRYRRAHRIASQSGAEFAQLIQMVVREVNPGRIWIVANSMGAEVVVHGFHELVKAVDFADTETEIENVVLTAPDVDREEFNTQFKQEIAALSKDLTVYVSSNDRALLMSRIIHRGRRLGESTLNPLNPDQLAPAAALFDLVDPNTGLISMVDVTPVNRTRNFHSFSLETPQFFDDLYLRLVNHDMPRSRPKYRLKTSDGRTYWILTRGR